MNIWRMEPALITGFVSAVLILLVAFKVPVSPEQRDAVLGLVAAAIALGSQVLVRSQVYSPHSVEKLTGIQDPPVPSA